METYPKRPCEIAAEHERAREQASRARCEAVIAAGVAGNKEEFGRLWKGLTRYEQGYVEGAARVAVIERRSCHG